MRTARIAPRTQRRPDWRPVDQEFQRISDGSDGWGGEVALGDYLTWLAEDLASEAVTDGTLDALGLVRGELRCHPVVAAQPVNHGIHQAIRAADRLRADYAALTGLALSRAGDA